MRRFIQRKQYNVLGIADFGENMVGGALFGRDNKMTKTQAALEALDMLKLHAGHGEMQGELYETIRSALKAQEWRDIGTCITTDNVLLYDPEVGIVEGYWDNYNWLPVVQSQSDEYAALKVSPTHWRPIPKPPEVGS